MIGLGGRSKDDQEPGARTRRQFARRQWARRWHLWRRLLITFLLAGLLATGVWLVWFSQVLAVDEVRVQGADLLSADQVRAAADVGEGEPMARVDLAAITRRVEALAPVRSANVQRQWPHAVVVEVEERVVIAVVDLGSQIRGMDRDGVVFTEYSKAPSDMPRVRVVGQADRDALREAARVVAALPPELARAVDHVDVETVDQISLVLRDSKIVQWGSAEQSEQKAAVLTALLTARDAKRYDVSVPGQPVVSG